MNCRRCQDWISLELDGQLAPSHVAALQEHLQDCADCRAYREDLQIGLRMLQATEPQLPENFDWKLQLGLSRAMREAAQEGHPWPERPSSWRQWFGRAGISAACGLAAVLTMAVVGPFDASFLRASEPAGVVINDPALRLPGPAGGDVADATRRSLDPASLRIGSGFGGSLQQRVSTTSLLDAPATPILDDPQLLRIRQLEQDAETLKRRLFAKDRQIQYLQAQLDSLSARGVDRD